MQEVGIHAEGSLAALVFRDRDLMRLGELKELRAARQIPFTPGRDHLDIGVERIGGKLETHLIVALAGGAVGDGIGAGFRGDLDQPFGDQRAGDRGAEQILALILRIGAKHRENEIAHEFLAQILDVDVFGGHAQELGLLARGLELLALAEIGGKGDHLASVFRLQPFEDDRGIEPPRIGKHDFFRCRHFISPIRFQAAIIGFGRKGQDHEG